MSRIMSRLQARLSQGRARRVDVYSVVDGCRAGRVVRVADTSQELVKSSQVLGVEGDVRGIKRR